MDRIACSMCAGDSRILMYFVFIYQRVGWFSMVAVVVFHVLSLCSMKASVIVNWVLCCLRVGLLNNGKELLVGACH